MDILCRLNHKLKARVYATQRQGIHPKQSDGAFHTNMYVMYNPVWCVAEKNNMYLLCCPEDVIQTYTEENTPNYLPFEEKDVVWRDVVLRLRRQDLPLLFAVIRQLTEDDTVFTGLPVCTRERILRTQFSGIHPKHDYGTEINTFVTYLAKGGTIMTVQQQEYDWTKTYLVCLPPEDAHTDLYGWEVLQQFDTNNIDWDRAVTEVDRDVLVELIEVCTTLIYEK